MRRRAAEAAAAEDGSRASLPTRLKGAAAAAAAAAAATASAAATGGGSCGCDRRGRAAGGGSREWERTVHELLQAEIALKNEVQLHEAVIKNEPESVRRALREPLDVNCRNNYGRAPIHWAASRGNTEIMEMLVAAQCDIEAKDKYGMRPLLMAAWHGHRDAVHMLVNCGADVLAVNKKGYTLLMCAARSPRPDALEWLLATLERPNLDATDADRHTALFHAAQEGNLTAVRRLMEAGARLDLSNKVGRTALHAAAERGHADLVELLLRSPGVEAGARDADGNSALHAAAEQRQTGVVQLLLERGCAPDPANRKGLTPLHVASSMGARGIMEALLQHGALPSSRSENGSTPLHLACQANARDAAELLAARGADLNALNARLQSPMHIAAEQGYADICKLLLGAGACIDQKEQGGRTPLYIAARGSFTAIVDMIIRTARLDCPPLLEMAQEGGPEARPEAASRWRRSCDGHASNERLRELLHKLAHRQLAAGEWKRLALHWGFTDDQVKAIEHQYTGPSSYKEHGLRMLLIWAHGLPAQADPLRELCDGLCAVGRRSLAESIRRKAEEEAGGGKGKRRCHACSVA